MRLATVISRAGESPVPAAAAPGGGWVPLASLAGREGPRMEDHLPWVAANPGELARRLGRWAGPVIGEKGAALLPPVVRPPSFRDFYAFEAHVKAARRQRGLEMPPAWYEIPVFYFSNPSSLVGHLAPVYPPEGCRELDYELELGIVIGEGGRDIAPAEAWRHVAGLTIVNDLSARDLQRREMTAGLGPAKGKDFATAAGPWLVTLDAVSDRISGEALSLEMSARVNGRPLSRGNTNALHHTVPRLVAQASRDADLLPGDLLGTGTVGTGCILELGPEAAGGWLQAGDVVELEIERIGILATPIAPRPAPAVRPSG